MASGMRNRIKKFFAKSAEQVVQIAPIKSDDEENSERSALESLPNDILGHLLFNVSFRSFIGVFDVV